MGGGNWNVSNYQAQTQSKIDSGKTFGYDSTVRSTGVYKAHADLNPKSVAGVDSPFAGTIMRESRDNPDHPNAVPICVGLDVTGSMAQVPKTVQSKLGGLFGLLLRKGYVEDPQILVSAYGDAKSDRVPLQVSQFESDNRIDENLDNMFLEGNGGGNSGESMSLLWYYLVHHTFTDSWDKRGKKGYAFFIADEISHELTAADILDNIGDPEPLGSITNKDLASQLSEKWDVYVLVINNSSAHMQGSEKFYQKLFGNQHVLIVEDIDSITETIALTIGVMEGTVDFDDAEADLASEGSTAVAIASATASVAPLRNLGVVPMGKGTTEFDLSAASGVSRL